MNALIEILSTFPWWLGFPLGYVMGHVDEKRTWRFQNNGISKLQLTLIITGVLLIVLFVDELSKQKNPVFLEIISRILLFYVSTVLAFYIAHLMYFAWRYLKDEPMPVEVQPEPEPKPEPLPPPVVHEIPEIRRYEHTLVLGSSGAGKTTLLADLIMQDVSKGNSTVVFDSKGSLVDALLHIRIPRERVILIDPTDERPIALGLFDFNTEGATHREREANLNRVIELLSFTLGALDADATSKQELPLRFLIRLCLQIPGATLLTLRDLLTDGLKGYEQYVQELPETARLFFQQQFFTKDLASTREQLSRRVYTILENPTMERMFSSPKTRFSMKQALDDGQFILVNTAKAQLGEERSAFFSRFIFALILQAVQQRDLSKDNTPTFIYIDEAAPVIDKNIATALETLREYKTGITLAFQNLGQIPHEFQQSIITNTSTKFLAGLSAKDARALAEDVGQRHESLLMQPRLSFHVSVRNLFQDTTVVTPGLLKKLPQRDDLKQLLEENREKYCVTEYQTGKPKIYAVKDDDLEDLNKA